MEDFNDLEAVQKLIEEANSSLGFALEEFTQLKEDHFESLKEIKDGLDVIFAIDGANGMRLATQDSL